MKRYIKFFDQIRWKLLSKVFHRLKSMMKWIINFFWVKWKIFTNLPTLKGDSQFSYFLNFTVPFNQFFVAISIYLIISPPSPSNSTFFLNFLFHPPSGDSQGWQLFLSDFSVLDFRSATTAHGNLTRTTLSMQGRWHRTCRQGRRLTFYL